MFQSINPSIGIGQMNVNKEILRLGAHRAISVGRLSLTALQSHPFATQTKECWYRKNIQVNDRDYSITCFTDHKILGFCANKSSKYYRKTNVIQEMVD